MKKNFWLIALTVFILSADLLAVEAPTTTPASVTPPAESFKQAQKAFREKRYKDAQGLLVDLVARYPREEFAPKAKLLLANLEQDFQTSMDKFKELAHDYVDKPEGEEALKNMGNRYYVADKYAEATETYKEFLDRYPKSAYGPEVRFFCGSSLLAQGEADAAVKQYEKVVKDAPDSIWAPKALLGSGTADLKKNEPEKAKKIFLRILDEYPLFEESNLVYYRLAQTFELLKKPKEAHASYATLISKFPKAIEVEEARSRMEVLEKVDPSIKPAKEEPTPETTQVVVVKENPKPLPAGVKAPAPTAKPFHIQVGVFTQKANAEKLRQKLKTAGYTSQLITSRVGDMPYPYYKVRVGSYADKVEAKKAADALGKKMKQQAVVIED